MKEDRPDFDGEFVRYLEYLTRHDLLSICEPSVLVASTRKALEFRDRGEQAWLDWESEQQTD